MVGIIALSALALNVPLIDTVLANGDRFLGFDAYRTVEVLAQFPLLLDVLRVAYEASVPLTIGAIILLCFMAREDDAQWIAASLVSSALLCAIFAAFFPAVGAFPTLGIAQELLTRLPVGSGIYHMGVFEALREGRIMHIEMSMLSGVITFPSFHAVMAMALAHAGFKFTRARLPVYVLATLIMISTIPIGGHYYVDIIAGILVYVFFAIILREKTVTPKASNGWREVSAVVS